MLSSEFRTSVSHTFYSLVIILTAYIMGGFPEKFYLLHGAKIAVYLLLRFYSFKKRKFHYYMCDYCYFVNLFSLYVSFVDPHNLTLQKILFVTANGPLALSIIVFKNKIVLHSIEQNTSVFIHLSAMLLSYVYRWNSNNYHNTDLNNESWISFVVSGCILYMIWSIFYGIMMFFVLRERILSRGNMTMFDWAIQETGLSNLKKISANEKIQQILYSCFHATMVFIAFIISPIFWYHQGLHFGYIMFIITNAFWNGSKYYVYKMNGSQKVEK
jgi:hypothetical protein